MFGQAAKSQNPSNGQERPLYDHSDDNRVSAPWIRAADEASPGCFRPLGPPNTQILAAIEIIWAFLLVQCPLRHKTAYHARLWQGFDPKQVKPFPLIYPELAVRFSSMHRRARHSTDCVPCATGVKQAFA